MRRERKKRVWKKDRVEDIKTGRGREAWRGWEKDKDEDRRAKMVSEGRR